MRVRGRAQPQVLVLRALERLVVRVGEEPPSGRRHGRVGEGVAPQEARPVRRHPALAEQPDHLRPRVDGPGPATEHLDLVATQPGQRPLDPLRVHQVVGVHPEDHVSRRQPGHLVQARGQTEVLGVGHQRDPGVTDPGDALLEVGQGAVGEEQQLPVLDALGEDGADRHLEVRRRGAGEGQTDGDQLTGHWRPPPRRTARTARRAAPRVPCARPTYATPSRLTDSQASCSATSCVQQSDRLVRGGEQAHPAELLVRRDPPCDHGGPVGQRLHDREGEPLVARRVQQHRRRIGAGRPTSLLSTHPVTCQPLLLRSARGLARHRHRPRHS